MTLKLPLPSFGKCATTPSLYNPMFSKPRFIIIPSFEPKLHNVMTLPSSHFDSVSLPLSNTYRHFDVTLRHGSIPSVDFSQFDTFLSLFGTIPISKIATADVLSLPYSFVLYFNRFCERKPMAPSMLNALDVSSFHLLQACYIRLAFQSYNISPFYFFIHILLLL